MMTLAEAKAQIADMLAIGTPDEIFASLSRAQRDARQFDGYTADRDEEYAMLRLALSDVAGNAAYRLGG